MATARCPIARNSILLLAPPPTTSNTDLSIGIKYLYYFCSMHYKAKYSIIRLKVISLHAQLLWTLVLVISVMTILSVCCFIELAGPSEDRTNGGHSDSNAQHNGTTISRLQNTGPCQQLPVH